MRIKPVKTPVITAGSTDINRIIMQALNYVPENCVLAITSKIVSLCEGNVVMQGDCDRDAIIKAEADYFLPKDGNRYGVYLTIKNNILIPNAGVDVSNANGSYVLWPKNPQDSANACWEFVREHYGVKNFGIIITDSTDTPLKWGVTGISIAHCGFLAVNDHVGEMDLFNQKFSMTKVNVADGLAAAAVLCMGETNEQTPLALIEELPFVQFNQNPPSSEELAAIRIDPQDDLFGQLLASAPWQLKQ